jgi:glycosyltransferase involved in cell wall biosynthesis
MITIGIDASRAEATHKTGVERYSFELIRALRSTMPDHVRVVLYSRVPLSAELGPFDERWQNKVLSWPLKYLWTQKRLSWEMLVHPPEVLFVPSAALPRVLPKRTVTTVHDASFVEHAELYPWWQRLTLPLGLWDTRRATTVIVPSEFARSQVAKRLKNVAVIPLGVSPHPTLSLTGEGVLHPSPYFLVVGRVDKKKNLEVVIDAFSKLQNTNYKLLVTGSFGHGAKEIVQHAQQSSAIKRIEFTGAVSDDELMQLYAGATALLHPCPVEGFGLPVIEAMTAGTPVIVADSGGAAEVAGDAAIRVAPTDPDAWAAAMEKVSDQNVRATLIEKGKHRAAAFTWQRAAHDTWGVLVG